MFKRIVRRAALSLTASLIVVTSLGIAWVMQAGASRLPIRQYFPAEQTNAAWDWSGAYQKTDKQLANTAEFAYLHQLDALYVDLGAYIKILNDTDQTRRAAATLKFESDLERYVKAMNKRGTAVYVAGGDVNWSKPSERRIPEALLAFAQRYNDNHPQARIAGFQFDIESYNQAGFAEASMTEKSIVLTELLDTVDKLTDQTDAYVKRSGQPFGLGFAIPYWFDNENGNIPSITWHSKTGPTLYHLADTLNRLPQANLVVMSYRNAANGADGVIAHARTEVDYSRAKTPNVKVLIGQETGDVEPAKITYYGRSATEFSSQARIIYEVLKDNPGYAGIAVNDLASYRQMDGAQ